MYKQFFAAFNRSKKEGNPFTRQELISQLTDGRTESLKDLSSHELNELVIRLNQNAFVPGVASHGRAMLHPVQTNNKADKMRKAIISIFYKMNRKADHAKAWAEKQGVDGIKKSFNAYTTQELYKLIMVAEKILSDYRSGIRKRLKEI